MAHSAGGMETALFSLLSSSDPFYDRTPWFKVGLSVEFCKNYLRFIADWPWSVSPVSPLEIGAATNQSGVQRKSPNHQSMWPAQGRRLHTDTIIGQD